MKDIYDRRAGDPLWNLYKLGAGTDLLDTGITGNINVERHSAVHGRYE